MKCVRRVSPLMNHFLSPIHPQKFTLSFGKYLQSQLVIDCKPFLVASFSTSSGSSKSKVQDNWAKGIIAEEEQEAAEIKINFTRTSKLSTTKRDVKDNEEKKKGKAALYRRRLADMSWTKEPIDDKLIWVDCEMTGLDYDKEMIMEIGCVITGPNLEEIARQPSLIVKVPDEKLDGMDAWCTKHHGESGLTDSCRNSSWTSAEVDNQLYAFIAKYTKEKECPMAGNSIYMDRIFITKQFPQFHSHFHYRNVDVSTIKELTRRWFPDEYRAAPKKKYSHRVLDDILDSIAELKYYKSEIFKDPLILKESLKA